MCVLGLRAALALQSGERRVDENGQQIAELLAHVGGLARRPGSRFGLLERLDRRNERGPVLEERGCSSGSPATKSTSGRGGHTTSSDDTVRMWRVSATGGRVWIEMADPDAPARLRSRGHPHGVVRRRRVAGRGRASSSSPAIRTTCRSTTSRRARGGDRSRSSIPAATTARRRGRPRATVRRPAHHSRQPDAGRPAARMQRVRPTRTSTSSRMATSSHVARSRTASLMRNDAGSPDVVSGERFVSAHRSASAIIPRWSPLRAATAATSGSVVIPGASFAHAIHQAGIPLVVGAQFPLSIEGLDPPHAEALRRAAVGRAPAARAPAGARRAPRALRHRLARWASLVVYEALPRRSTISWTVQYFQAKRAMNAALERVDNAVLDDGRQKAATRSLKTLDAAVDERAAAACRSTANTRSNASGCARARRKRLAQAAFMRPPHATERAQSPAGIRYDLLEQARLDYDAPPPGMLVNDSRRCSASPPCTG